MPYPPSSISTGNNNLSLCIGASNTSINTFMYHFKGLINDVRIYDRALSAAEVQALYNLGQ
ncbi:MAG TPA: hypothetical protein DCY32_02335 [Opitutae bacterium]|nr:hypothetical protein [Opitutae bacterium]